MKMDRKLKTVLISFAITSVIWCSVWARVVGEVDRQEANVFNIEESIDNLGYGRIEMVEGRVFRNLTVYIIEVDGKEYIITDQGGLIEIKSK